MTHSNARYSVTLAFKELTILACKRFLSTLQKMNTGLQNSKQLESNRLVFQKAETAFLSTINAVKGNVGCSIWGDTLVFLAKCADSYQDSYQRL